MTQSTTPTTDVATGRIADLARRIGCTDGQLYTMTIGLSVALLLLAFGVPGTLGGAAQFAAADEPAASVTPTPTETSVTPPTPPTPPSAPVSTGVGAASPVPAATSPPSFPLGPNPPTSVSPLDPPPFDPGPEDPSDPPPDRPPCPTTDAARPVLDALAQTGVFPDQSTTLILARITGCSQTDPAVLLLGALAEFGSNIPDPGVGVPIVPIPFVELPAEIVDAVQPFRDAIDPMCDGVGAVTPVFSYGFGTWPAGIGPAVGTPIRQVLLACGQLRPA